MRRQQQEATRAGLTRCHELSPTADIVAGGIVETGILKTAYKREKKEAFAVEARKTLMLMTRRRDPHVERKHSGYLNGPDPIQSDVALEIHQRFTVKRSAYIYQYSVLLNDMAPFLFTDYRGNRSRCMHRTHQPCRIGDPVSCQGLEPDGNL